MDRELDIEVALLNVADGGGERAHRLGQAVGDDGGNHQTEKDGGGRCCDGQPEHVSLTGRDGQGRSGG